MVHPSQQAILDYFDYQHLQDPLPRGASAMCHDLAHNMVHAVGETEAGAELTTGLRKLLEAKDCFVRAAIKTPLNHVAPSDEVTSN